MLGFPVTVSETSSTRRTIWGEGGEASSSCTVCLHLATNVEKSLESFIMLVRATPAHISLPPDCVVGCDRPVLRRSQGLPAEQARGLQFSDLRSSAEWASQALATVSESSQHLDGLAARSSGKPSSSAKCALVTPPALSTSLQSVDYRVAGFCTAACPWSATCFRATGSRGRRPGQRTSSAGLTAGKHPLNCRGQSSRLSAASLRVP